MARKQAKFFETKHFGLVIGLAVFLLLLAVSTWTTLISNLELKVLDLNFRWKNIVHPTRTQEGVVTKEQSDNPYLSSDILIVGIDDKSLDTFGRWPFPRHTHAGLLDTFARIKEQDERERALLLDVFFIEPSLPAEDALLVESIRENGRVFLEPVLTRTPNPPGTEEQSAARQQVLFERFGRVAGLQGDWTRLEVMHGFYPPLKPYTRAAFGYGHATYVSDEDETIRRHPLLIRTTVPLGEIRLEELSPADLTAEDRANHRRLAWIDTRNNFHEVPYPLTGEVLERLRRNMQRQAPLKAEDTDGDEEPNAYFHIVRKYQDYLLPSITLTLALEHFHRKLSDLQVELGKQVLIPAPERFNRDTGQWEPLGPAEIRIPIDDRGQLLINYMGAPSSASPDGRQTFPVRSFAGYASRNTGPDPDKWPRTMAVPGKIILVGAFSSGMAEDEKPTPFGLMYGVEIHANALNTIIMRNFLRPAAPWANAVILLGLSLLAAFLSSRLPTIWSLVLTLLLIVLFFFTVMVIFDVSNRIITLSAPIFAILLSFLAVIAYRIMTEEREKRFIRETFGKVVSPNIRDHLLQNPPELGGVRKEISVLFSDIRGFTSMAETMSSQELIDFLNRYLTPMTDVVFQYQGTLDKYIGDAIMCFWGAPVEQPEHALLACKCALRQMQVLEGFNRELPPERRINIGIGINSGYMTAGNVGSPGRMNFTLIGDEVNLGSRLEATNKEYGTNVIISEFTYGLVKERVVARELDVIRAKGKARPVVIYELADVVGGLEPPATVAVGKGRGRPS